MEKLVSVIIPVYNVEKFLAKCIDSILLQTYKEIEVIIVDDGSTDNSGNICDQYEKKDKRVKVIHKKNGGLSDARNVGIENANGKYITFIDSDDFVPKDSIEILYNNIIKYKKDISIGQINTFDDENLIKDIQKNEKVNVYDKEEAMENLLYNTKYTSSTAGKLFDIKLFDSIKYPYGKKYEDLATVYKLVDISNGVVVTDNIVYYYFTARESSIMNEKFSSTRMQALSFTEEILDFVEKKYPRIKKSAEARLLIEARDIIVQIPEGIPEFEKYLLKTQEYIRKYRFKVIFDSKLPIKRRISLLPVIGGKKIIKYAWKLKNKMK